MNNGTNKEIICEGLVIAKLYKNDKGNVYISYYSNDNEYLGTQFIKTKEVDYYVNRIK